MYYLKTWNTEDALDVCVMQTSSMAEVSTEFSRLRTSGSVVSIWKDGSLLGFNVPSSDESQSIRDRFLQRCGDEAVK